MATVVSGNTIKTNDGKTVVAQQGGWYDGQQFWGGSLSAPGVINSQSNQQGAGAAVSPEVNKQSSVAQGKAPDAIAQYLQSQNQGGTPSPSVPAAGAPSMGAGAGVGAGGVLQPPATIDLKGIYDKLYKELGISDKEAQIAASEKSFLEARNKISNNPYLSVSNMDNRITRIRQAYEQETAPLRNEVAAKKADVEMRLNLETKQFDINSQQAQQALTQFNSLLEMGALDGASGEDIASITRATGLSSNAILSAIKAKKISGYSTTTQTFDDGTNEGFIIYTVDQNGNVINQSKQVTGKSKAKDAAFDTSSFMKSLAALQSGGTSGSAASSNITSLWGN